MDVIDEKIIEILLRQGYKKSSSLSAQLGIGERTIRRRLNALLRNETIKVVVHTNPIMLGYKCWARIGLNIEPGFSREVGQHLKQYQDVHFITESVGQFDMMVAVRFKDEIDFNRFINMELLKVQGIRGKEVFYLVWPVKYHNFHWSLNFGEADSTVKINDHTIGNNNANYYELDEIDKRIVNLLTEKALIKSSEISKKLDVSEGKIRNRLKKMTDSDLFRIDVLYYPGHDVSATIGIDLHQCSIDNVLEYIVSQFSCIQTASFCIGRFNIMLTASFRDNNALNEFVNISLKSIKGVSSVVTFMHTKRIKYHVS